LKEGRDKAASASPTGVRNVGFLQGLPASSGRTWRRSGSAITDSHPEEKVPRHGERKRDAPPAHAVPRFAGASGQRVSFRCAVPRDFLLRMRIGDPADPLLRQVLPLEAEEAWRKPTLRTPSATPMPP